MTCGNKHILLVKCKEKSFLKLYFIHSSHALTLALNDDSFTCSQNMNLGNIFISQVPTSTNIK